MRRTNLRGHALRSEGAAYIPGDEQPWLRTPGHLGRGLCECDAVSLVMSSDSARRRWHARHKDEVRASLEVAPTN